jgi:hypothetical protein
MARGRSVIVGGGLGAAGVLDIGGILVVANTDPPTAQVASGGTSSPATFDRALYIIGSDGVTIAGTGQNQAGGVFIGNTIELTNQTNNSLSSVYIGNGVIHRSTGGIAAQAVIIGGSASAINAAASSGIVVIGYNATVHWSRQRYCYWERFQ